jgi:hypothetical protein
MVEFVLNELDQTIISQPLIIQGKSVLLDGADACAVYDGISVNLMKSMFLFQSFLDTDNAYKLKYYTFANPAFDINLSEATLNHVDARNPIANLPNEAMFIANDFVRYLAESLFGSYEADNLFINKAALLNDLTNKIDNSMTQNYNIFENINAINGTDASLNTDIDLKTLYDYRIGRYIKCYTKYFMDDNFLNKNLSRELLLQMLYYSSDRFVTLENITEIQPLPFISGDTINFKLEIHASPTQTLFNPIKKRIYQIKIIIKEPLYIEVPLPQKSAILNYTTDITSNRRIPLTPFIQFINYQNLNYFDYILFKVTFYIQTNIENTDIDAENYYFTSYLKIYPKAFHGLIDFSCNNIIDGNSDYQIELNESCPNGRMFYLLNTHNINNAADFITIRVHSSLNYFYFVINPYYNNNDEKIINFQLEIINNGLLPLEYISTQQFDINFI